MVGDDIFDKVKRRLTIREGKNIIGCVLFRVDELS